MSLLVLLHNGVQALATKSAWSRKNKGAQANVLPVPPEYFYLGKDYNNYQETQFARINLEISKINEFIPPNIIILESNYGFPGSDTFCNKLFEDLKVQYSKAKIIVYSSTSNSLVMALDQYPDILAIDSNAVCDLDAKYGDQPRSVSDRIYKLDDILPQISKKPKNGVARHSSYDPDHKVTFLLSQLGQPDMGNGIEMTNDGEEHKPVIRYGSI